MLAISGKMVSDHTSGITREIFHQEVSGDGEESSILFVKLLLASFPEVFILLEMSYKNASILLCKISGMFILLVIWRVLECSVGIIVAFKV